ncbi:HipA domain-containing protein [Achromobacter insolitus]|uniref:HipA domain-containing protein n=1 Tax=Achromobacter insolitus TaxID=217204 RepID=UPI001680DA75|nr:HipA domain-containing protein [Achromobacter insolitus]
MLAATIRNGDAHLKNFGLLYEPGQSPRLSPVYDMLTMAAYAPRDNFGDANDGMALTLGGTKSWPTADALKLLGKVCDISKPRQKQWQGRMGQALIKTVGAVEQFQADNPDVAFAHAARMVELWAHGMRQVDAVIADELMERAHQLEGQAAGPA